MPIQATQLYKDNNTLQTKKIIMVVSIAGVPDVFTSTVISNDSAHFGDGSSFGDTGLIFGNLFSSVFDAGGVCRDLLSTEQSSVTISQKVEPEQGRASVSQFTLCFIDKDSYMTRLISPGIIIPDIMGAEVKVFLGYAGLSYPVNFLTVFRGYVSGIISQAGMVTLQLSDPNLKRRQQLFSDYTTTLTADINNSTNTIPIANAGTLDNGLYITPSQWDGSFASVLSYIQIDDEIIQLDPTTITPGDTTLISIARGSMGTTAAIHTAATSITQLVVIQGTAINLALQIMLSGWGGAWLSGVALKNIGYVDGVGVLVDAIQFPAGIDVIDQYGIIEGDWIQVVDPLLINSGFFKITAILDSASALNNVAILVDTSGNPAVFTSSLDTASTGNFRSQYDILPVSCGLSLTPKDVDVAGHLAIQETWTSDPRYSYQFTITQSETSGKTFLESQIYLPIGCYSLTKRGLLSVGITKPPVGGAPVVTLDYNNVMNPETIRESRALNNRKFFNQIQFQYDVDLAGDYLSTYVAIDSVSLSVIGFLNTLPITSNGGTTALGTGAIFANQANLMLTRYARGAQLIELTVNYGSGNLIEAGDLVILKDNGTLQISNFVTGVRDLGVQYFEVENRSLDIKSGNVKLTLISGIGAQTTDRFGIISPSSLLSGPQTASQIIITDSFGALYPGNEPKKWKGYVGQLITVHSADYSVTGTTTLVSQDLSNAYKMNLSPPLGFTPASGYVVDIPDYPTNVDPIFSATYKNTFAFADPQISVTGGSSATVFTVGGGDISKFFAGCTILVHNSTFSVTSPEVIVLSAVGTTVTVSTSLGFTPSAGYLVELVGFSYDGGAAYRFVT